MSSPSQNFKISRRRSRSDPATTTFVLLTHGHVRVVIAHSLRECAPADLSVYQLNISNFKIIKIIQEDCE